VSAGAELAQAAQAAGSTIAVAFLEGTMRTATPLALAAAGELVVERAGIINIGLEGVILAGAFGALVGATHGGTPLGYAIGAAAGMLASFLFALIVVSARGDQIITGMALTLLSLGVTGTLYRTWYGEAGAALSIATSGPLPIVGLSRLPLIGKAVFAQPAITYLAYATVPLLWWWMTRTHAGLSLRAIGESPLAAEAAGVPMRHFRFGALLYGGAMGGLAGAALVLAQAGTFVEGMSAGRGFIAIAIVVLGRWHPIGVALAALLFGGTTALQYLAQAMGLDLPYQLFLALPYALTLAALAGVAGRATPPATLARIE
jgi:general nucleoside transport system permease protein